MFLTLYDGSTEALTEAIVRLDYGERPERTIKGREFCGRLRLESERSVLAALNDLNLTGQPI